MVMMIVMMMMMMMQEMILYQVLARQPGTVPRPCRTQENMVSI